ncbi:MAG: hypothetical protein IT531_15250 [Burkholderiales bacterium]|nr:hypothetical protein [Burkholderiales bacterium]
MCDCAKPPKPSESSAGASAPGCASQTCPAKKIDLVEFVEVVARSPLGTVEGAGKTSSKLKNTTTRSDKNGGEYKQFINIDKDIEGAPKRHPEYARYVDVRARIEGDGALAGKQVKFRYELTAGKDRPAGLAGSTKEGFGAAGSSDTHIGGTDEEGWTDTVAFYLSQYAGDKFKLFAQALDDAGKPTGAEKQIGSYEVWRKFWYQITRATTHAVPAPSKSITAYNKVFADMLATDEVTFTKASSPANTFYPGWMVRKGGADSDESVIGGHNREEFYKKFKAEADKPVKGHLIICQHQWDPAGESDLHTVEVKKNPSDEITIDLKAGNAGIIKPALTGDLVVLGTWSGTGSNGNLSADNILIEKARGGLNRIKVSLPAGAPDPTKQKVIVKLKLAYGKFYAGESNQHNMLIVYRGEEANYNQVVSHEFGHGFGQTPRPGSETAPLAKHAKQYDNAYGGVGSHCSTDASLVDDTSTSSKKRYTNGTCIMFHQVNPSGCKQVFCAVCEPHLKLRDMSSLT